MLEKGRWSGPAQIVIPESRPTVWITHFNRLLRCATENIRPVSSQGIPTTLLNHSDIITRSTSRNGQSITKTTCWTKWAIPIFRLEWHSSWKSGRTQWTRKSRERSSIRKQTWNPTRRGTKPADLSQLATCEWLPCASSRYTSTWHPEVPRPWGRSRRRNIRTFAHHCQF